MGRLTIKNVSSPDEVRQFAAHGHADVVDLGGQPVLLGAFEPGWTWSGDLKPVAQTESCEAPHLPNCIGPYGDPYDRWNRGRDRPGGVASIAPGHDAWVIGDEACIAVDFGGYSEYAKG
jgi:hypothetical protein